MVQLETVAQKAPFDLVIVGGGINGAALAREGALRGWRTALFEQGDFGGQTSSLTSKLAHGGLRYLERFDLPLVRESLIERWRLLNNATHLVEPLEFLLPVYRPGPGRPLWQVRVGLELYHLLAGRRDIERPRICPPHRMSESCPLLRREGLRGAVRYFEAWMDDARIVIELLKDAARHGAVVCRDARVVGFHLRGSRLGAVDVEPTGEGNPVRIGTRMVVSTTGPWTDQVWDLFDPHHVPVMMHSRGAHIVLDRPLTPAGLALQHPEDGRLFFVIPWQGRTLVGTTEEEIDAPLFRAEATEQEKEYLLSGIRFAFPGEGGNCRVTASFAGVRPLVRQQGRGASQTSRREWFYCDPGGFMTVAGGKYTTFRIVAEKVARRVSRHLKLPWSGSLTTELPLVPEATLDESLLSEVERVFGRDRASRLVHRYGCGVSLILGLLEELEEGEAPVAPGQPETLVEARFCRDHEWARRTDDFLFRRTTLGYRLSPEEREAARRNLTESGIFPS